ncbi:alpha-amylase family glycosyl hydrolase [Mycoplasma crocodyli]|uniref:Alpha-amylase n=1 Tax=Mycoplasma crocodyli (strain ATCC 51981 / MP145) TaxID=512564 RepID=D5E6D4_MYCCM|nr:alpha-amylase family glycosyl hydrolase [Mycoplasma crocodyli]ADE19769.1 alpha-amylase (family 13 glycosyl hydrolase) [Mycoplasma crocodyli MP145]
MMKKNIYKTLKKLTLISSPILLSGLLISCSPTKGEKQLSSSWGSEKYRANLSLTNYENKANEAKFIAPFNNNIEKSNINYQLLVYSFADGNGDGIGDFIGLKNNLNYFTNLGIDQLYLSPIHPSSSYHGYDVIDYCDVAKELGGMEAFKEFLIEAHKQGIRVYLDMVFNHTSFEHPWFQEALKGNKDYEDYYRFMPSKHDDIKSAYGIDDANIRKYTQNDDPNITPTNKHYVAAFSPWMPDLNLDNPKLRNELKNVQKFWAKLGVDGFRYDAFYHYWDGGMFNQNKYEPTDGDGSKTSKLFAELREATNSVMTEKERHSNEIYMFGEWWKTPSDANMYFSSDKNIALNSVIDGQHWKNGDSLSIEFNNEKQLIKTMNDKNNNQKWMPFLDNHDVDRWINKFRSSLQQQYKTEEPLNDIFKSALQAALVQLVLRPGLPTLYHGDELDMHGNKKTDPNVREPFNWEDPDKVVLFNEAKSSNDLIKLTDSKVETTVEKAMENKKSTYNILKKAIDIKKKHIWISEQNENYIKNPSDYFEGEVSWNNTIVRENEKGDIFILHYTFGKTKSLFTLKSVVKDLKIELNTGFSVKNNKFESEQGSLLIITAKRN